jgi:hypothetical protein
MQLLSLFWSYHPFEHFVNFLSAMIIVLTFASMVYPKTRAFIKRHLADKKTLHEFEETRTNTTKALNEINRRMSKRDNIVMNKLSECTNQLNKENKNINARMDILTLSQVTILHDRIYSLCSTYIKRGNISPSELDNVKHLVDVYHNLGGNGTGTELYNRVRSLPLIVELYGKEGE